MPKRLIFRLSSLGDLVIALAALEVPGPPVEWVVAHEWAELFQGHPRVSRVWTFEKGQGLRAWISLCRVLWGQGYSEVLDLHGNIRTGLAHLLFRWWDLTARGASRARWKKVPKQRFRLWGHHIFKGLWPKFAVPASKVSLVGRTAGGSGKERPTLAHMLRRPRSSVMPLVSDPYLCVMPSSRWAGKDWPAGKYVELLRRIRSVPVVLGRPEDANSRELFQQLEKAGVRSRSLIGKLSLVDLCHVLAASEGYLGSDTGIAHMAQALGKPSAILYGPTSGYGGFRPWSPTAVAVERKLWCRPCSKDGRACFRPLTKYACLTGLTPEQVSQQAGWIR